MVGRTNSSIVSPPAGTTRGTVDVLNASHVGLKRIYELQI